MQAANAFLKTLEEPPSDVVLILLARTRESVLPTILSRCQVVPFRTIPASEAAGIIVQNTGASREQARMASRPATAPYACRRSSESTSAAFRTRVLEVLGCLRKADDWTPSGSRASSWCW